MHKLKMPDVLPFRALHYNQEKIKDIQSVVAPPYDIISNSMQDELYNKSQYNIVRIILGKILKDDTEKDNRYTRAKNFLSEWMKNKILVYDNSATFYIYEQSFEINNTKKKLSAFIGICRIEDFENGNIKPHERTFKAPIKDRLMLMHECMANPEPIYCLYSNPKVTDAIKESNKDVLFDFNENTKKHVLSRIQDNYTIERISKEMIDTPIYIADGHHRYQTALEFSREMQRGNKSIMPYNYIMMLLADIQDDSIIILPTHRVIQKKVQIDFDKVKQFFDVIELGNDPNALLRGLEKNKELHSIGLSIADQYYIIVLKDIELITEYAQKNKKSILWNSLDVSILDNIIIQDILGMENYDDNDIIYTRDCNVAIRLSSKGVAFLLKPPKIEEVKKIADMKETMPHKSTYFYPKPLSGLVLYKF